MIDRSQVEIDQTWDLTLLFKDEAEYEQALETLVHEAAQLKNQFEGKIQTPQDVSGVLSAYRQLSQLMSKIGNYVMLHVSANMLDTTAQERNSKAQNLLASTRSQLSFVVSELSQLNESVLKQAAENKEDALFIEKLLRDQSQLLSKETESVLAALSNTLSFPYQNYNDIKFRDVRFPKFEVDGKVHEMTYNSFEGSMESEVDTPLRRKAFDVFSNTLSQYQHSTASAYNAHVQMEKTMATLRGFDSVFDYLLDTQQVSSELYHRQIDMIMEHLAPHMRRYAKLLGKLYNLDKVRYEDLKLNVDPDFSPEVTYEQAKAYVLKGVAPLGKDYLEIMEQAFDERWIDYAQTTGKRTGAFCSSPYGERSFILMFFSESMDDVMTLAHELGHAGHFQMAHRYQNIFDARASLYFIEAPSTTNELLVEQYLLDEANGDHRMTRWIKATMIGKTYYHNFVTHFMEAYFQREVYRLVDKGFSVDAPTLNRLFKETLEKFWGDAVELTPGAELTWMRQPHYYMGLYPYTYSAGLTIGTQVAKNIRERGESYAQQWVNVLQMGGSQKAEDLAKAADVDLTTSQPLENTIAFIGELIDDVIALSDKI
ncbi:oligoendopeptidase F [Carnobacteriaceae bacterium zg-ZUI252]|nr:oligoendopeptidase F [Carnobacteriaceae bacterium zg-ZUI252]